MSQPIRTCVGCRRQGAQHTLVRIALVGGSLVIDRPGGRGAWVCPDLTCLDQAVRKRSVDRALRAELSPEMRTSLRSAFVQATLDVGN